MAAEPQPAANGSVDALALRLLEELRAAQQEAQTAREEAQAARLAEQEARYKLETTWERAFDKAEVDAEATVQRLLDEKAALTGVTKMLQRALRQAWLHVEEAQLVALYLTRDQLLIPPTTGQPKACLE